MNNKQINRSICFLSKILIIFNFVYIWYKVDNKNKKRETQFLNVIFINREYFRSYEDKKKL